MLTGGNPRCFHRSAKWTKATSGFVHGQFWSLLVAIWPGADGIPYPSNPRRAWRAANARSTPPIWAATFCAFTRSSTLSFVDLVAAAATACVAVCTFGVQY